MIKARILRHTAIAALALAVAASAMITSAEAGPVPVSSLGGTIDRQAVERSGNLVEAHDDWGHGRRHWRNHHRHHHRKHWKHRRHYDDDYYYDRPVVVERYRYVERYPAPRYYYYNPFNSLFGALVFNFSFDGDRPRHRHHHRYRD